MMESGRGSCLRWEQFKYAAHVGHHMQKGEDKDSDVCEEHYSSCPYSTNQLINTPVLTLWQLASKYLSLRIDDS